jgi:hypothetical protein
LSDLPLDLRQDSAQDSGVVDGEFKVEYQAPQLEECSAPTLGL